MTSPHDTVHVFFLGALISAFSLGGALSDAHERGGNGNNTG